MYCLLEIWPYVTLIQMYIWEKYEIDETMKIPSSSRIYNAINRNGSLERENDTVLKFCINDLSYFEISASLF